MPHLSPMNWLAAPILFSLLSLPLLMSLLWWSQTPAFPNISITPHSFKFTQWNWL